MTVERTTTVDGKKASEACKIKMESEKKSNQKFT